MGVLSFRALFNLNWFGRVSGGFDCWRDKGNAFGSFDLSFLESFLWWFEPWLSDNFWSASVDDWRLSSIDLFLFRGCELKDLENVVISVLKKWKRSPAISCRRARRAV